MRNFRTLKIWEQGMTLAKLIYDLASQLPIEEKYGLRSQITRAAVSVPSNIAEGCSRNSDKEYKRYLEIAIGSLFEIETQLMLIVELNLVKDYETNELFDLIDKEGKMINGLINRIKNASKYVRKAKS